MAKRPPPPPRNHPTETAFPRPPCVPLNSGIPLAVVALAQEIMDLCHRRGIHPKDAACACACAAGTFNYQATDRTTGERQTDALATMVKAMTLVQHETHPKPTGAMAPEPAAKMATKKGTAL